MHQPVRARNDKGVSAASCGIDRTRNNGSRAALGPPVVPVAHRRSRPLVTRLSSSPDQEHDHGRHDIAGRRCGHSGADYARPDRRAKTDDHPRPAGRRHVDSAVQLSRDRRRARRPEAADRGDAMARARNGRRRYAGRAARRRSRSSPIIGSTTTTGGRSRRGSTATPTSSPRSTASTSTSST